MVQVSFTQDTVILTIQGADKLWSLTSQLTIPLAHVRGAYADPTVNPNQPGLRMPGAFFPGVITAGTFYQDGQRVFWDVHNPANAVVFELSDDRYDQLIVEVAQPRETVRAVWAAIRSQTTS